MSYRLWITVDQYPYTVNNHTFSIWTSRWLEFLMLYLYVRGFGLYSLIWGVSIKNSPVWPMLPVFLSSFCTMLLFLSCLLCPAFNRGSLCCVLVSTPFVTSRHKCVASNHFQDWSYRFKNFQKIKSSRHVIFVALLIMMHWTEMFWRNSILEFDVLTIH